MAAQIFDPKTSRLTATIAGWQTPAAARQVSLVLNKKILATKTVHVPADGRAQVEFLGFDVPYGDNRGEIRIEPHDALPEDDTYPFSVDRADPRRVLFLICRWPQPGRLLLQGGDGIFRECRACWWI